MLIGKVLNELETSLRNSGISDDVRQSIRNSKICIIDDGIADLKSITSSLKKEGFTNLIEFKLCPAVNDLLNSNYDLIVLDLNNVASEIAKDDGLGVLDHVKSDRPSQAVLIVTGQKIPADKSKIIQKADLVRKKPIRASDLAKDVEEILRITKDKFWASLTIIKELNRIDMELKSELTFWGKIKYSIKRKRLENKLINKDEDIIVKLDGVVNIVKNCTNIALNHIILR